MDFFSPKVWVALRTALLLLSLCGQTVLAEMWVCPRSGEPDLYIDHPGPGCSQLGEAKTYSSLHVMPAPAAPPPPAESPTTSPSTPQTGVMRDRKPAPPFSEVSLAFPIVAVSRPIQGSITGSWLGLTVRLTVGYLAGGNGPQILTDGNLRPASMASLRTAIVAAAGAVGYDPRFLKVRLWVPTGVDGPSAGGMYAVAIAAALLGDQIRPDVCMSGTIEPTLEIKPVGRLIDKMNACQQLKKTVMLVPDGLDNSHLSFKGAERAIHVVEVHTLADAYAAATGQVLREVRL
jgi:hypothetical protein